jgi:hypothetical protein
MNNTTFLGREVRLVMGYGALKMKKLLTIILIIWTSNSFAQEDSTSLYYQALWYYNISLDKSNSKETELFIEKNDGITEKLPTIIGTRTITILTWNNQKEVYERNNNRINQIKIFPARIKGDLIEVVITPYHGNYLGKRKGLELSLSDWVIIQFKYDCDKKKYIYYATTEGGI